MQLAAFRERDSVRTWRALGTGLHGRYRCNSLSDAAAFVAAIVEQLPPDSSPDIDLRANSVTVRLPPVGEELADEATVLTAQMIEREAQERGLPADPASLRSMAIAIAQVRETDVTPFWAVVLGYVTDSRDELEGAGTEDPAHRLPPIWFDEHRTNTPNRGRTHIDVYLPAEEAEATVRAALEAGGRIGRTSNPPHWWTLISPDGHGIDIAPWPDRVEPLEQ